MHITSGVQSSRSSTSSWTRANSSAGTSVTLSPTASATRVESVGLGRHASMVKLQHTSKLKTCSVQHCGQFFVASGSENCLLAFKHETAQRSHGHISGNHTLDGCVLECRFFVFERFLLRALRVWLLFLFFPNDFHCDMRATDSEESKQMSKRTKDESAKQTLNKSWPPVSILDVCSWSVDGWSLCASTQATGGGGGSMSRRRRCSSPLSSQCAGLRHTPSVSRSTFNSRARHPQETEGTSVGTGSSEEERDTQWQDEQNL